MYDEDAWNFGLDESIFDVFVGFQVCSFLMFSFCSQIIREEFMLTIGCTIRSFVTR